MLFRNKTLLAKVESTYGTDPTPTGTDAVLTRNLQIQPYAGPTVPRNLDRSTLGGQSVINTNPQVILTFEVEFAGSGSAGTAPAWGSILRACGFSEADSSPIGTSKIYTPLSTAFPSVTFYFYHDGMRHRVYGARGNVSMAIQRGENPAFSFTFTGQYETPTAASPTGVDVSDYIAPLAVTDANTPTFTLNTSPIQNLVAEGLSIDMGNVVVPRNLINNNEILITDRNPTGSTVIESVLPSTYNYFGNVFESDSTVNLNSLSLVHGTTSGNIIGIDCPAVQVTSVAQNDSEGQLVWSLGLALIPSAGNDEITITVY